LILLRALSLSFSSSIADVSILKHESHTDDLNFLAYLEFNVQSFAVCCSHFWALFLYGFNLKARFQSQNNKKSINVRVFGVYAKLAKQLDNFTWTLRFIWCFFFFFVCFISENLSFFFFWLPDLATEFTTTWICKIVFLDEHMKNKNARKNITNTSNPCPSKARATKLSI